jgi:hypothetical protein
MLRAALEEALGLAIYLRAAIEERDNPAPTVALAERATVAEANIRRLGDLVAEIGRQLSPCIRQGRTDDALALADRLREVGADCAAGRPRWGSGE